MSDWKNVQYKDGKLRTNNGGSGGASALSDLTDVDLTNIADGQILKWDATNSKWVNANESGGSGHTYSTTEQVVGTWTDGKPIYEIVIKDTMPIVTTDGTFVSKAISCSSLNIDRLINLRIVLDQNPHYCQLPYFSNSGNQSKAYYNETDGIYLWSSMAVHSGKDIDITLQYTKTTD